MYNALDDASLSHRSGCGTATGHCEQLHATSPPYNIRKAWHVLSVTIDPATPNVLAGVSVQGCCGNCLATLQHRCDVAASIAHTGFAWVAPRPRLQQVQPLRGYRPR